MTTEAQREAEAWRKNMNKRKLSGPITAVLPIIVEGSCYRVVITRGVPGQSCSSGDLLQLFVEDDGHWFEQVKTDVFRLNEIIDLLQNARTIHNLWPKRNEWDGIPND